MKKIIFALFSVALIGFAIYLSVVYFSQASIAYAMHNWHGTASETRIFRPWLLMSISIVANIIVVVYLAKKDDSISLLKIPLKGAFWGAVIVFGVYWVVSGIWHGLAIVNLNANIFLIILQSILGLFLSLFSLILQIFEIEFWSMSLSFLKIGAIVGIIALFIGYLKGRFQIT